MRSSCAALLLAVPAAFAQVAPADPDWKEADVPAPPALRTGGLIPLELPRSELRFGVDPASVSLGKDGIVRYVVVAQSAGGTVNAMYEGLRCDSGEVKVYARHYPETGWKAVADPAWRPLHESGAQRHSLLIARTGACLGHSANRSVQQIVRDLRSPVDHRFSNEAVR